MVTLSREEKAQLNRYLGEFNRWFLNWVFLPVKDALVGLPLNNLQTLVSDFIGLSNRLTNDPNFITQPNDSKILKCALLFQKRHIAERQEQLREINTDVATFEEIDNLIKPVDDFLSQAWLVQTEPVVLPKITDFLTIEVAYKQLHKMKDKLGIDLSSIQVQYDEKFGILQAPGTFLPRLRNYRIEASMRDVETSIAFIDIDNFKQFNTAYTESRVDRDILPAIMRTLEAHIFSHGWAFRFGGDEYMLLLPNTPSETAQNLLLGLQKKLKNLKIIGVDKTITVSIGLCTIPSGSILTDREIKQLANDAKEHAKKEGEKNCVAFYQGTSYQPGDLTIVRNK